MNPTIPQSAGIEELLPEELNLVSGGGDHTISWPSGETDLGSQTELTGSLTRPVFWADIVGSGHQVYIDGQYIDTEGFLGLYP